MTSNFLIIGGNSDIASVLIEYLLQQDAQLTVLVRQDGDSSIHSSSVNMIVGDATQEDDLQKAIDKALENGKIDGIVHCVGSIVIRPPHAMKKDAFEEVILTNLTSAGSSSSSPPSTLARRRWSLSLKRTIAPPPASMPLVQASLDASYAARFSTGESAEAL